MLGTTTLLVVIVLLPVPYMLNLIPIGGDTPPFAAPPEKLRLPYTLRSEFEPLNEIRPVVGPATVILEHTAPVTTVQVYAVALLDALNTTSSLKVGTPAPPAPPDVKLQLVVVEAFQVPAPPTQ
jgi:hypothetical protein